MLEVQKYLNRGNRLEDLEKEYGVYHRIKNGKVVLSYDQIKSPMGEKICQECRGLVLREHTWEIVCFPFKKFFNSGEGHAAEINWETARVLEKIDGCLDKDTVISTEVGFVSIEKLCEMVDKPKVYSYNVETQEIELDEIIDFSIKKNIDNWFEIELEDGTLLKLTGNHRVYIPALNCYRQVQDLGGDEEFLLEKAD